MVMLKLVCSDGKHSRHRVYGVSSVYTHTYGVRVFMYLALSR